MTELHRFEQAAARLGADDFGEPHPMVNDRQSCINQGVVVGAVEASCDGPQEVFGAPNGLLACGHCPKSFIGPDESGRALPELRRCRRGTRTAGAGRRPVEELGPAMGTRGKPLAGSRSHCNAGSPGRDADN